MKKITLIILILIAGCKTGGIDEKGRLEKVRIQIPAFIDIEFEYYKDKENLGKVPSRDSPADSSPNSSEWPKLMPLRKK